MRRSRLEEKGGVVGAQRDGRIAEGEGVVVVGVL